MDKRGQFFIFVAIIVALLVFTLITKSNTIREEVTLQNFEQLSQNYLTESPKVINYAIYSVDPSVTPEGALSEFTEEFVGTYAQNNDPNIGLVYVYNDPANNKVVIENLLNGEKVTINPQGQSQLLFSITTDNIDGELCVEGIGCQTANANLCQNINQNYCVLSGDSLSGPITLKIGDINYNFPLPENNPSFIVIVKSTEGDTTKVDISQNTL